MGFFDFFRKKKEEPEKEEIGFDYLESWIKNKKVYVEKNLVVLIKNRVSELIKDLRDKKNVIDNLDLKEKKVEERVKLIVGENLRNYSLHLGRLIETLMVLDEKNPEKFVNKINSVFSDFDKKSLASFEKSTFIIGKELEDVKETIRGFFKNLEVVLSENKSLFEISKIIPVLDEKVGRINEIERISDETIDNIVRKKEVVEKFEEEIVKVKEKIGEVEKSEEYLKEKEKIREVEDAKEELGKKIDDLKEGIDFKILAEEFHSDEKKMNVVRKYKDNFRIAFEEDKGEKLGELVDEVKVSEKIEGINKSREKVDEMNVGNDEIEKLNSEVERLGKKIDDFRKDIDKNEKLIEKFKVNGDEVRENVKRVLEGVGVEVG